MESGFFPMIIMSSTSTRGTQSTSVLRRRSPQHGPHLGTRSTQDLLALGTAAPSPTQLLPAPLTTLQLSAPTLGAGSLPLVLLESPICAVPVLQTRVAGPGAGRGVLPSTAAASPGPVLLPPVASASLVPPSVLEQSPVPAPGTAPPLGWALPGFHQLSTSLCLPLAAANLGGALTEQPWLPPSPQPLGPFGGARVLPSLCPHHPPAPPRAAGALPRPKLELPGDQPEGAAVWLGLSLRQPGRTWGGNWSPPSSCLSAGGGAQKQRCPPGPCPRQAGWHVPTAARGQTAPEPPGLPPRMTEAPSSAQGRAAWPKPAAPVMARPAWSLWPQGHLPPMALPQ